MAFCSLCRCPMLVTICHFCWFRSNPRFVSIKSALCLLNSYLWSRKKTQIKGHMFMIQKIGGFLNLPAKAACWFPDLPLPPGMRTCLGTAPGWDGCDHVEPSEDCPKNMGAGICYVILSCHAGPDFSTQDECLLTSKKNLFYDTLTKVLMDFLLPGFLWISCCFHFFPAAVFMSVVDWGAPTIFEIRSPKQWGAFHDLVPADPVTQRMPMSW